MIPIIINNFNRLSTTRKMVEDLHVLGYTNITILDNSSSFQPLLNWYNTTGLAKIVMLRRNVGPLAIYDSGYINNITVPWYVYTDSDIELNPKTPRGFIETLIEKADQYNYNKSGLALKIDDIQEGQYGRHYTGWESQFWTKELEPQVYGAQIDTTFAAVRHHRGWDYEALRLAGDFTARHIPWYTEFGNLSEEEKHFLDMSSNISTYKKHYRQYSGQ